jgi:hypothetical protein
MPPFGRFQDKLSPGGRRGNLSARNGSFPNRRGGDFGIQICEFRKLGPQIWGGAQFADRQMPGYFTDSRTEIADK